MDLFDESVDNTEVAKKKKGTGPSQSVRDSGPAGKQVVGSADRSNQKVQKDTVTAGNTKRSNTKVGSSPNASWRTAQQSTPTTTQKKTGTVKKGK